MKLFPITCAIAILCIAVIALSGCGTNPIQLSAPPAAAKPFIAKATAPESFAALETADLAQALTVATASNDIASMQCIPVVSKYVAQCQSSVVAPPPSTPITAPTPCGLACQGEVLRVNAARVAAAGRAAVGQFTSTVQCWTNLLTSGTPQDLLLACAAVVVDPLDIGSNLAETLTAAKVTGPLK